MSITIGELMDEAAMSNNKEGMKALGVLYYNWFARNDYALTPQTASDWRNTPVIEILKQEVSK